MYFDTLTLASLVIFAAALGAFVYACLFRGCITATGEQHDGKDGS
ncbi:MAG: hypothetical protein OEU91_02730 [Gammaproteobacteria bacterium]|nr:hypothetical protein [Gammaproteobacteria bacterium]